MSIRLLATLTPAEPYYDEVRGLARQLVGEVRTEAGCESYELFESRGTLVFLETWLDRDALNAHGEAAPFQSFMAAVEGKLANPLKVDRLRPVTD